MTKEELLQKANAELEKRLDEYKVGMVVRLLRDKEVLLEKVKELENKIDSVNNITSIPEGCY